MSQSRPPSAERGPNYTHAAVLGSLFCSPTDCSPPGSSVHGVLQARILEQGRRGTKRILEQVATSYSVTVLDNTRNVPDPEIELASLVSPALAGGFSTTEPLGKPYIHIQPLTQPTVDPDEIQGSRVLVYLFRTGTSRKRATSP